MTIRVNLKTQRLHLLVGGEVAIDSPVSTGRKSLPTPCGQFEVEKREATRKQEKYGNFVSSSGAVVLSGVYADLDPLPSDLEFKAVAVTHVLTLKGQKITIHGGTVGNLPTSDGSVVVPRELAKTLFGKVPVGCRVEIVAE
ncbi:MAG: L,D-transpeptidase [Verrucomicrobiales bacterium]